MTTARTLARATLVYVGAVEFAAAMLRHRVRSDAYAAAMERAADLGRPLVVIGDPDAGLHTRLMRAYGCGDVCVDAHGCRKCPETITADIAAGPIPGLADNSAVVFVSCVLEYVPDLPAALAEIARVAGSVDNVFLVTVQPWTLTARLYPGAVWRGSTEVRGDQAMVSMTPVTLGEKLAATALLGLTAAIAFWPKGQARRGRLA